MSTKRNLTRQTPEEIAERRAKRDPAEVIASRLAAHARNLRSVQRRLELFMPKLQAAIDETHQLAMAFGASAIREDRKGRGET